jgi:hypothetical protein
MDFRIDVIGNKIYKVKLLFWNSNEIVLLWILKIMKKIESYLTVRPCPSWFLYFAILHFAFSDFIHEGIPGYKIKFSFFSTMYNLSELCGFVFTWDEFGLVWDVNGCPMFEQWHNRT